MPQTEIFIQILLTVIFGAIIGLESETREIANKGEKEAEKNAPERIGGLRTYTLISLFGGISGIFYSSGNVVIAYILSAALLLLVISAYILNVQIKKAFGMTTEIAIVLTFLLGFLTTSRLVQIEIVLGVLVLLSFFLSQKRGIGLFIHQIEHKEVIDMIKFGLVALVILPLLPNTDFRLIDFSALFGISTDIESSLSRLILLNPYQVWSVVVLISGFNLLGYFLSRFFGKTKGLFFSGMFSGLISSTAATVSFAHKSKLYESEKKERTVNALVGSSVVSTAFSFTLAGSLALVTSREFFIAILPLILIMIFSGVAIGIWLTFFRSQSRNADIDVKYEPFSVLPAMKFVAMIVLITIAIQIFQLLEVNQVILILLISLTGAVGIDAPTIAIAGLVASNVIQLDVAVIIFVLMNTVNLIAKIIYSKMMGSKRFFHLLSYSLITLGALGIIGAIIL